MQQLNYRNKEFTVSRCASCNLSILAGPDGFCFAIYQPGTGDILLYQSVYFPNAGERLLLEKLIPALEKESLLQQEFKECFFVIAGSSCAFIPANCHSERLVSYLLPAKQPAAGLRILKSAPLDPFPGFVAFPVYAPMLEQVTNKHPDCRVEHEAAVLLRNMAASGPSTLLFHLHSTWLHALCIRNSELLFANTFETRSDTDRAYYMRLVIKQLEWQESPVLVTGSANKNGMLPSLLRELVPEAVVPADGLLPVYPASPLPLPLYQLTGILSFS